MTPLRLFVAISLRKLNEDNLNEPDNYGVPFSEQQYTLGSYKISLFKYKSFDRSNPPESFQILDIYSVVVLQSISKMTYISAKTFSKPLP